MTRRAFTLIEIIIVLLVIASLSLIAYPTWQIFADQTTLQASGRLLVSELQRLQATAELEHQTKTFDPTQIKLPKGLTLSGKTNLAFSDSGFPPPGGSGTLIITSRFGRQLKLVVSSVGRIRLE
jgi:prepilin-type N-terminal cleavage/methylation domain-containing protein